ncbi:hypothetical protein RIF29_32268 [Crotalaria pallida]|uniref:Uncharacterized protein n=1 Tax=Crotalaria pallida TaxID=3830 RepID=A0AAN9HZA3_CROPI
MSSGPYKRRDGGSKILKMRLIALASLPFLLLLFVTTVESRKDLGKYLEMIMNNQKMPEKIHQDLLKLKAKIPSEKNPTIQEQHVEDFIHKFEEFLVANAEVTKGNKVFVEDFEPRPSRTIYDNENVDTKENKEFFKDFKPKQSIGGFNSVNTEFEPIPSASAYNPVDTKFEPRSSASAYNPVDNPVDTKFEPRPSASAYNPVDTKFEPRPSASAYNPVDTKFEPRPSVTAYNPVDTKFEPRPNISMYNE